MPLALSKRSGSIFLVFSVLAVSLIVVATIANQNAGRVEAELAKAQNSLGETQSQLAESDQFLASALLELDQVQEEFLFKSARQTPPSNDYTVVRRELMRQMVQWIENSRVSTTLPLQESRAYYRMGQLASLEGNNLAAIQALQHASLLALKNNDKRLAARTMNSLACSLAQIDNVDKALVRINESITLFRDVPDELIAKSIAARNRGLLLERKGQSGIASVRDAIDNLSDLETANGLSIGKEILIDSKVLLAQLYLLHNEEQASEDLCRQVILQLQSMIPLAENDNVGSDIAPATRRYRMAIALLNKNLQSIANHDESTWRWNPLVDLTTEVVMAQPKLDCRAVAEFEHQSGIVLAWGGYSWAHDPVLEIARATHDRWRMEIIADSDEALENAVQAFHEAEIPTSNVRFGLQNYEVPWFRDTGPIVTKTADGNAVWIDSNQVRFDVFQRPINNALPRLLSTRWNARIVNTPLSIAGGTVLSNGQGLTICSKSVIEENVHYGFEIAAIRNGLQSIMGAKEVLPVPPLIAELTGHLDLFLTFTDAETLVVAEMMDHNDRNRPMLDSLAQQFAAIQFNGRPLRVVRMPLLPLENGYAKSYTNVVFANGVLLVPSYQGVNPEIEATVRKTYQTLLPDWEIKFIDCTWLASKGGSLHCLSSNLGPTPHSPLR